VEEKILVSIRSSNRLLRESIARILTRKREFAVIATEPPNFPLGQDLAGVTPDVWVSDSLQCFIDGVFPYQSAHNMGKPAACVLLAMQDDAIHFLKAVRRGVLGYVLQEAPAEDVISAIRAVAGLEKPEHPEHHQPPADEHLNGWEEALVVNGAGDEANAAAQ